MSDYSTIREEQRHRDRVRRFMTNYDNFQRIGDVTMARVSTLSVSEVAERLDVSEKKILWWLRVHGLSHKRDGITGTVRIPLIEYPILKALSEGKDISEARATVADIHQRIEERGGAA